MTLPQLDPQPVNLGFGRPMLLVVVDTEEEFDWMAPFSREATATTAIAALERAHAVFDPFGIRPTYVIDYPVATSPQARNVLRKLALSGRAVIGAHCHPWVNPPHREPVTVRNSYHGNLDPELEADKLRRLTEAVAEVADASPAIFKAGRYGIGPGTFATLVDLGYRVDCSIVPHHDFSGDGGPDFRAQPDRPFFTDSSRRLLEVPLTGGFSGRWAAMGPQVWSLLDSRPGRALHLPGIASRLRLLERARISPEGFSAIEQIRLIDALVAQGHRLFTLSFHSPSLAPGHTPYVRDEGDLAAFMERLRDVLLYFRDGIGGGFTDLEDVDRRARGAQS
jgi:hypothetical protein